MLRSLFCYGTLQVPRVFKRVTGREFHGIKVVLKYYTILRVRGTEYPGIIPQKGFRVKGLLYNEIERDMFQLLDDFEGDEYSREIVNVFINGHTSITAYAYIIVKEQEDILSDEKWFLEHFLNKEIDTFIEKIRNATHRNHI